MRPIRYTILAADVTNGFTPPLPVDRYIVDPQFSLAYRNAAGDGAGAGTFQVTFDNVFDSTITPTWQTVSLTSGFGNYSQPATAFRASGAIVAGETITIVQQGGP